MFAECIIEKEKSDMANDLLIEVALISKKERNAYPRTFRLKGYEYIV